MENKKRMVFFCLIVSFSAINIHASWIDLLKNQFNSLTKHISRNKATYGLCGVAGSVLALAYVYKTYKKQTSNQQINNQQSEGTQEDNSQVNNQQSENSQEGNSQVNNQQSEGTQEGNSQINKNELPPLHQAIESGDVNKVQSILKDRSLDERCKIIFKSNCFGETSLHKAVSCNNLEIAKLLLKKIENKEHPTWQYDLISKSDLLSGYTPFHLAAKNGNFEIFNYLLKIAYNVGKHRDLITSQDSNNRTLLHWCAIKGTEGHVKILKEILNSVTLDLLVKKDFQGDTVLHEAVCQKNIKILKVLCDYIGLDYFKNFNLPKLDEVLEFLSAINKEGYSAFLLACSQGSEKESLFLQLYEKCVSRCFDCYRQRKNPVSNPSEHLVLNEYESLTVYTMEDAFMKVYFNLQNSCTKNIINKVESPIDTRKQSLVRNIVTNYNKVTFGKASENYQINNMVNNFCKFLDKDRRLNTTYARFKKGDGKIFQRVKQSDSWIKPEKRYPLLYKLK